MALTSFFRPGWLAFYMVASLCSQELFAQSKTERAEVNWGAARDEKKHGAFGGVEYNTADRVYIMVYRKGEPWLQVCNTDLVMLGETALPLEMGRVEHDWEDLMFLKDKVLLFTSVYRKDQKRTTLYARSYDLTDLHSLQPLQELLVLEAESKKDRGWFRLEAEPDSTGFRLWATAAGQGEHRSLMSEVKYYSSDLKLAREAEEWFERPYPPDEYDTETSFIEKDGTRYVMVRKYPEKRETKQRKREGKPSYDMVLAVYDKGIGKPALYPLDAGEHFLQDLRMELDQEQNEIICAGFYGNKGSWSVRGAVVMKLDRTTKAVKHQNFKEFDREFITSYMTEKEERKATKKADKKGEDLELYEYDLDEIILRDDGGAVLVGEQYYSYVQTITSTDAQGRMISRTVYHYVYNDIIVVSIDRKGDIEWAVKVPKRQHTTNDGGYYSSYGLTVKGDRMYFVFNDNGKNLFLSQGSKVEQFDLKGKEALITLVTVDATGRVTREALLAPDKRDAILRPKECFQLEDDRMFIYAERKKEYRFGTISFK